jgi:hypothetical protein
MNARSLPAVGPMPISDVRRHPAAVDAHWSGRETPAGVWGPSDPPGGLVRPAPSVASRRRGPPVARARLRDLRVGHAFIGSNRGLDRDLAGEPRRRRNGGIDRVDVLHLGGRPDLTHADLSHPGARPGRGNTGCPGCRRRSGHLRARLPATRDDNRETQGDRRESGRDGAWEYLPQAGPTARQPGWPEQTDGGFGDEKKRTRCRPNGARPHVTGIADLESRNRKVRRSADARQRERTRVRTVCSTRM